MNKSELKEHLLLIGNPGVGKSTLLNCLIKEVKFKSGLSIATGMTQILQWHEHSDGVVYADTPGLSDIFKKKEAALQITKALQRNGIYKLIFVLTVESGRIRPDDITTMNLVLESIKQPVIYGVIINKCTESFIKGLNEGNNAEKIVTSINSGKFKTFSIHYMNMIKELDDENGKITELPIDLINFINNLGSVYINKKDVKEIVFDEFEKMNEHFKMQLNKLEIDNKMRENTYREMIENLKKEQQQILEHQTKSFEEYIKNYEQDDKINKKFREMMQYQQQNNLMMITMLNNMNNSNQSSLLESGLKIFGSVASLVIPFVSLIFK
eukprot:TRINITY_DN15174_c0_g1_i1.p1 TRINITY_DN15174_c0_g1~~TRINITY_DN15174_c0_g1_i1.p1  ORF type:complete len:336 (-),score=99.10 TRINITY_DN15174_c0_g1_i1:51-1025(-)